MTSSSSSALLLALLANLALSTAGCGVFGADEPAAGSAPDRTSDEPGAQPDAPLPKAPSVGAATDTSELTEAFGVFVAPTGKDDADGTRERPVASVQGGIELGKKLGKRVYVCTGTYREALVIADSISVIGGLDCSGGAKGWRTGAARTRIEAPTSPAVRAGDIVTATRLEGLDIVAPNAVAPSSSSIGLQATNANALVVASSRITAGDGAKGDDGAEGIQLTQDANADGQPSVPVAECVKNVTCKFIGGVGGEWIKAPSALGGTNTCIGAAGIEAQPGGFGGTGGLWEPVNGVERFVWQPYKGNIAELGVTNRTSAAGADGTDAPTAPVTGSFSPDGYIPADGIAGTNGLPGKGGVGGQGDKLATDPNAPYVTVHSVWRGFGGSGGGAGGCPGLAGTPGKGGGASIGVLLHASAIVLDGTEIIAGRGGAGGLGAFGSVPTPGGAGGTNSAVLYMPLSSGKSGGRGGAAGVSSNGSSGPSVGIAHFGEAPSITGNTKVTPGAGGDAIDARSRTDALSITKTVPASAAGLSKDVLAL